MASCRQIVTSLLYFQFMANLEQFGSWIPEAWPKILTISLIVTFYLTKTGKTTKTSLTQLPHYCFEKRYYFFQKMLIFCKKTAKLRESRYKKVCYLKLHRCVYLRTKFQVSSIILTSFRQRVNFKPSP